MFRLLFRKVRNFITSTISGLFMTTAPTPSPGPHRKLRALTLSGHGFQTTSCFAHSRITELRALDSPEITKIEWCKTRLSPFHEFIIAYSDKWVLVTERGRDINRQEEIFEPPPVPDDERAIDDLEENEGTPSEVRTEPPTTSPSQGSGLPADNADPDGANLLVCTCPRNSKTGVQIQPRSSPSRNSKMSFPNSSSSASLDSVKSFYPIQPQKSHDEFKMGFIGCSLPQERSPYNVMYVLDLSNCFRATDFALLAHVVHTHAPAYTLLEYQCYWYAKMVYKYIKEYVGGKETTSRHASQCGTFGPLPVPKGKRNSLSKIKREFKVEWDRYNKELLRERQEKEEKEQQEKAEREAEQQRVKDLEGQAHRDRALREEAELEAARQKKLKEEAELEVARVKEEAELEVARLKEEADRDRKRAKDLQRDFEALRAQLERSPTVQA